MKDKFSYDAETMSITIVYPNYGEEGRGYGELFDWLGEHDVVTASDVSSDLIVMSDFCYEFTHQDEAELETEGSVTLSYVGTIDEQVEDADTEEAREYLEWYR